MSGDAPDGGRVRRITREAGMADDEDRTPTTPTISHLGNVEQLARVANVLTELFETTEAVRREYDALRSRKEVAPHSWDGRIRAMYAGHIYRAVKILDGLIKSAPR